MAGILVVVEFIASMPAFALATTEVPSATSKAKIMVNRSLPIVRPPSLTPSFSDPPTDAEVFSYRFLEDSLVPMLGTTSAEENRALVKALLAYRQRSDPDDFSEILSFLQGHPDSAWRVSLLANLGYAYRRAGYFSKALTAWQEAWQLGRNVSEPRARVVVDRVAGEIAELNAWVGRYETLGPYLQSLQDRELAAPSLAKVSNARESLWMMLHEPEQSFKCGPYALGNIYAARHPGQPVHPKISEAVSTDRGTSLAQMRLLAEQTGLDLQVAKRSSGAPVLVPALVHWKLGHFGALIKEQNGRYLLQDPTFDGNYGREQWISAKVLDEEASEYFLVPSGPLPSGWRSVPDAEAQLVWGRGVTTMNDQDDTTPCDQKVGGDECDSCAGMARYSVHAMLVSLNITDTPLRYKPPRGPAINFTVTYNQKEADQPSPFGFSNMGYNWTHNWLGYVEDFPNSASSNANLYVRGGGMIRYGSFNTNTQSYAQEIRSGAVLVMVSTNAYERRFPNGSKEVYATPDTGVSPRRIFLTQVVDLATNTVTLTYDSLFRLTAIQDAIGQVTTLSYEMTNDVLKLTKVTDPFGRTASFCYNATCDTNGLVNPLAQITDQLGLTSQFSYSNSFINAMTTPYGTTSFLYGETDPSNQGASDYSRYLEVTDPLGMQEMTEFVNATPVTCISDPDNCMIPTNTVPTGFSGGNQYMNHRNTFFWDKKAMEEYPLDVSKARQIHWLHDFPSGSALVTSGYVECEKNALENAVWYLYWNQTDLVSINSNMLARPAQVARVLDDGTTQLYQYQYNAAGNVTNATDPLGRQTVYLYDTNNNIDLLQTQQAEISGSTTNFATLSQFTYNSQHLPTSATDASGQTGTFTYNQYGQLTSVTNPLGQSATMFYDGDGYLTNVVGAVPGATTSLGYARDGGGHVLFGRPTSITDSEGYSINLAYDAMDRVTNVTYPDGTTYQTLYNNLDPVATKDRLGRWTRSSYDADRRLVAVTDALGHFTQYQYCACGALENLIDQLGHITTWTHDLQGRLVSKQYDDGSLVQYAYENTTSRLTSMTDAQGQTTQYAYNHDNTLQQISYSNTVVSTPSVSYTYDTNYDRVVTMVDTNGTTTYTYNPTTNTVLGAGRLASAAIPLLNATATITYGYDQMGRVISRAIDSVTNRCTYDNLGRVVIVNNALGVFTNTYVDTTARLAAMTYPNGQIMTNTYLGNLGDERLGETWNQDGSGNTLSKFDYAYDAVGQIKTWTQQSGVTSTNVYAFTYDRVNQLIGAALQDANSGTLLTQYFYAYDDAGNRTSEQIAGALTGATANDLNQITALGGGGQLRFEGSVNKTSLVTVAGSLASMTVTNLAGSNTLFDSAVNVSVGTNMLPVIAADFDGNSQTNTYQVIVSNQTARTLLYDSNGNLTNITSGSACTNYQWDAANRLVGIVVGTGSSPTSTVFGYDGLSHRVRITEIAGTTTNSDRQFVWCGTELCEERDMTGTNVTRRFFGEGEQIGGTNYFFTRDHLGSIRELTDTNAVIRARYGYDPYGRRSANQIAVNPVEADFGFTGHYFHAPSGLHLTLYRAYSADLGRWNSRDPVAEAGGINLYAYVANVPVSGFDPLGEQGVATAASSGIPEAELGETSLVSQGEVDAAMAALEEVGGISLGAAVAAGAVGGAVGFASGRLADDLTGGSLSGGIAKALRPLTDALYGANDDGSSVSSANCPDQFPDKKKCDKAIKILEQYARLSRKFNINIGSDRISLLNQLRDSGQITSYDLPGTLGQEIDSEFQGLSLNEIKRRCGRK
ncbi:MAG TPA: RHS repeat-associated core domain-containing protein [Verrucomicrobiae bacterium]|nr:RHS repeat-associated core domain-containing protein [Verrucomicrobiae bacterium]